MQSDVNFPLVPCKPATLIIQPKFNQCKRFVLHPHFPFIYLTISILGSSIIFGLSPKYTLRFVPSNRSAYGWAAFQKIVEKETTDIKGVVMQRGASGHVYNLQGMHVGCDKKLQSLPAGVYIVNGKKMVVRK